MSLLSNFARHTLMCQIRRVGTRQFSQLDRWFCLFEATALLP